MATGWGPPGDCPGHCGQIVQWRCAEQYANGGRFFDAGTMRPHTCPNFPDPPLHRWVECMCGVDIEIVGETRYDRGTTKLHLCRPVVRPAIKPTLHVVGQSNDRHGPVDL